MGAPEVEMLGEFNQGLSLGRAAHELGHDVWVKHVGSRFQLVCTCGFETPVNAKRKTAFVRATEHVRDVVREDRERKNPRPPVESRFL